VTDGDEVVKATTTTATEEDEEGGKWDTDVQAA